MSKIVRQYCLLLFLCIQTSFLFASHQVGGYQDKLDSIRKEIDSKSGKELVKAQLELALMLAGIDKKEADQSVKEALEGAKRTGDRDLVMQAYYVQGKILVEIERYEESQAFLDTALLIVNSLGDNWHKGDILYKQGANSHFLGDEIGALRFFNSAVQACRLVDNYKTLGSSYSMMGTIFRMNGLYNRAIEYIIKSELNYEKAGFVEGSAWADYLLGRTYADLDLSKEAMEYFRKSLTIYTELAKIDGNRGGMAICYAQIALLNIENENYDEARKNIEKTREIYEASESRFGISNVYKDLGVLEYTTGNYDEAEKNLRTALAMKGESQELLGSPAIYEYLGLAMIGKGQFEEGVRTVQRGLNQAIDNDQKKIQFNIYEKLTEVYLNAGDLKNAIDCQNKQIQIQNLILAGGGNVKASQLAAMYEIDQKNSQIAELEKQNKINELNIRQQRTTRNLMISGIVLAFVIAVVMLWFYRKLRRANRDLYETNATKDKFFAIISHDLRGPTGSLTSFLQHLSSNFDYFTKEELKETMGILTKSAENVSELLENLLIWAQSQAAKIEYRPERLSLTDSIESVIRDLSQVAKNKEIAINFEKKDNTVVFADRNMLQAILRNIISNAIKFTYRGGSVSIQPELNGKNVVLVRISDTGMGIDKSKLSSIFDVSSSYHTNGTENEMSTGLGLVLVKDFVEKNNGTISIESEQKKGTTVSFTLPVAPSRA